MILGRDWETMVDLGVDRYKSDFRVCDFVCSRIAIFVGSLSLFTLDFCSCSLQCPCPIGPVCHGHYLRPHLKWTSKKFTACFPIQFFVLVVQGRGAYYHAV